MAHQSTVHMHHSAHCKPQSDFPICSQAEGQWLYVLHKVDIMQAGNSLAHSYNVIVVVI